MAEQHHFNLNVEKKIGREKDLASPKKYEQFNTTEAYGLNTLKKRSEMVADIKTIKTRLQDLNANTFTCQIKELRLDVIV